MLRSYGTLPRVWAGRARVPRKIGGAATTVSLWNNGATVVARLPTFLSGMPVTYPELQEEIGAIRRTFPQRAVQIEYDEKSFENPLLLSGHKDNYVRGGSTPTAFLTENPQVRFKNAEEMMETLRGAAVYFVPTRCKDLARATQILHEYKDWYCCRLRLIGTEDL